MRPAETACVQDVMLSVNKDVIKDYANGPPDLAQCSSRLNLCEDYVSAEAAAADNGTAVGCSAYKFASKVSAACTWPFNSFEEEFDDVANETLCEDKKAYFKYCLGDGKVDGEIMASAQKYYDEMDVVKESAFGEGVPSGVSSGPITGDPDFGAGPLDDINCMLSARGWEITLAPGAKPSRLTWPIW